MSIISAEAAARLKTALPIIETLRHRFEYVSVLHDYNHFRRLYIQIQKIIGDDMFDNFVGSIPKDEPNTDKDSELYERIAENISVYVKSLLDDYNIEEKVNNLIKENLELRKQIDEINKREATYISVIKREDLFVNLNQDSKAIPLESLKRQHIILSKNLARLEETRAKHGINTPIDVHNAIDHTKQEIDGVSARIEELQGQRTPTNTSIKAQ